MALLERVSTLIRANINDLVDKAEDPEKMIKQVILDMQNQLLQVKTQVAIAIADQHLLEKKQKENLDKTVEWTRKAELAVSKKQDDLARAAIERSLTCKQGALNFEQQVADQKIEVENLKTALRKLEQKLEEAQAKCDCTGTTFSRCRKGPQCSVGLRQRQARCYLRSHEAKGRAQRSHQPRASGAEWRHDRRSLRYSGTRGRDRAIVE